VAVDQVDQPAARAPTELFQDRAATMAVEVAVVVIILEAALVLVAQLELYGDQTVLFHPQAQVICKIYI